MNQMPVIVQARNLAKSYGQALVLSEISLDIRKGEVVALLGPSGSGKSTLCRCLNLLASPSAGVLTVCDQSFSFDGNAPAPSDRALAQYREKIGMVFQSFNLFPHKTVLQNVIEGPLVVKHESLHAARTLGLDLLHKVGMDHKADSYPEQLSGGQQQRVAIARALAMKPEVMLFDEATSALDPELVTEVLGVMRDLATEGMTMVVVTHEMSFARNVADRILFMKSGRIVDDAPAQQFFDSPQTADAQQFLRHLKQT